MLVPLRVPPGVRVAGTERQSMGRWRDANFIRWVEGVIQPVGPWSRITDAPLPGRICGMQPLRDNVQRRWLIVGSNEGVWTLNNGVLVDRTPGDFTPGEEVTATGNGYGSSFYGAMTYGTPRSTATGLSLEADTWSFDTWGEFVVGVAVRDSVPRVWKPGDLNTAEDAEFAPIANAPTGRALVVTNERHLMVLGAGGDPRLLQWSAREDYTDWTPTALNLAGDLLIETSGTLQTALQTAGDILLLSDTDAYRIRYVGQPFGYGQERAGTNCGVVGPQAGAATNDFAVWMGTSGFWLYQGQVQSIPCDVWDYVFRDINTAQMAQVTCDLVGDYNEVWWFYPSRGSAKNDRYVAWNYRDNWWTVGALERTHWQARGVWTGTVGAGVDGYLYEHEQEFGGNALAARSAPFVESAPIELGDGDRVMFATQLIPDRDSDGVTALQHEFDTRFAPRAGEFAFGPYTPDADGYTDLRFSGREVQWRVTAAQDTDWRLGACRLDLKPGGRR